MAETPEGFLTSSDPARSILWVPSRADGTVTRLDTVSGEELARYRVTDRSEEKPVAIAVTPWSGAALLVGADADADEFVHRGSRVTRVGVAPCPDLDGDGVHTSQGFDDVLAFGEEECLLWSKTWEREFSAIAFETRRGLDGAQEDFLWLSAPDEDEVLELDPEGEPTGRVAHLSFPPSGLVISPRAGESVLNVASQWPSNSLARIDTVTLEVREIGVSQGEVTCAIATDIEGNVWIPNDLGAAGYYVEDGRSVAIEGYFEAVAATDHVFWGTGRSLSMMSIDTNDWTAWALPIESASQARPAVTLAGDIVVIDSGADAVDRFEPELGAFEPIVTNISEPGVCGDATGIAVARTQPARGAYEHAFSACPGDGPTTLRKLFWQADTPPSTRIDFSVALITARDAGLEFEAVGSAPEDASPLDLNAPPGIATAVAVRAVLVAAGTVAPVLRSLGVAFECP